jgi:sulfite reductase alpha subunit-like flavoprotein
MSDSSTGKNYTFEKMVESSQHDPEDVIPIEKVVILYASETGNSQDTAERIGREFRRYGKRCTVTSMELFDVVSYFLL